MSHSPLRSPAGVEPELPAKEWLYRKIDEAERDGALLETFEASEHVASPWGNKMHHGGPLAALAVRSMEQLGEREGAPSSSRLSRVTMNMLGAVPITQLRTRAWTIRPGRRIALLGASIEMLGRDGEWVPVIAAEGWRLATQETGDAQHQTVPELNFIPESGGYPEAWPPGGFAATLAWGGMSNEARRGAPTQVWATMHHALVEGETATALQEVIAISDCANGIGARLDPSEFTFLNTDLAIHLHHPPTGSWFGMEAETTIGPDGIGLSHAVLHDANGPIGRVTQNLLVERRL